MRCRYAEVPCASGGGFICLRCVNCKKQLSVARNLRDKLDATTAVLPDCAATTDLGAAAVAELEAATAAEALPFAAFPPLPPARIVWDPTGAGTQLKFLLSKLGIKSTENCSCNARARAMNERGIEWCEQNVGEIVGWLKEEATRRNLPFLAYPTKLLVQRAIKIAKRQRDKKEPQ
jgi:hypothetical protein